VPVIRFKLERERQKGVAYPLKRRYFAIIALCSVKMAADRYMYRKAAYRDIHQ